MELYLNARPRISDEVGKAIKLIHADDLSSFQRFPSYRDLETISYYDYILGVERLDTLKSKFREALRADGKLRFLNTSDPEVYKNVELKIRGSLWKKIQKIQLEPPTFDQTTLSSSEGEISGLELIVRSGLFSKEFSVVYSCPRQVRYASTIQNIGKRLEAMSDTERACVAEVATSKFNHPVLFISHRWETPDQPDPDGRQLSKLRQLSDCYIIYDYSSFPQEPFGEGEKERLAAILSNMQELVRNLVVLKSDDYLDRGWCIYEYLVASFNHSVVCDEVNDWRFVSLREWSISQAPMPRGFRDSGEMMMRNYIAESLLHTVNLILPVYREAKFLLPQDRELVNKLLHQLLKSTLPSKAENQPYLGESKKTPWSDQELTNAFNRPLEWQALATMKVERFKINVPHSLRDAAGRNFKIRIEEPGVYVMLEAYGNPFYQAAREFERKEQEYLKLDE
jgi:hypothetical protein